MARSTPHVRILWLAAILACLALGTVAWAQVGPAPCADPPCGHGPGAGPHGAGLHFQLSRLDLTDEQKAQVHTIFDAHRANLDNLRDRMQQARRDLHAAVHADTLDATAIRDAAALLGRAEGDIAVERAGMLQEMKGVLTAEQWTELREMPMPGGVGFGPGAGPRWMRQHRHGEPPAER